MSETIEVTTNQSKKKNRIQRVLKGTFIHSLGVKENDFQILHDYVLGVESEGTIAFFEPQSKLPTLKEIFDFESTQIQHLGNKFMIPGFIDTHVHAPQYTFTGSGYDLPLLEWLQKYTFPAESRFSDLFIAEEVYSKAVSHILRNGTTTACYFATIYVESTQLLTSIIGKHGQRAHVGKVCMDQNSPDFYVENKNDSLKKAEAFIQFVQDLKNDLITPIITPRFVPSCSSDLMRGLGDLAKKYDVPIQSHISENISEVNWVGDLHVGMSYADVYHSHGLLNEKTVMAHAIYLTPKEIELFKLSKSGVAHCPVSNFALHSGQLNVRHLLNEGIKVGLGTDVSGGYSPSILENMRQAITNSSIVGLRDPLFKALNYKEVFAMATIGGAAVLGLEKIVGNFEVGKKLDALIIDPNVKRGPFHTFSHDTFDDIFQKFVFLGDDRNIDSVFVDGKLILQY